MDIALMVLVWIIFCLSTEPQLRLLDPQMYKIPQMYKTSTNICIAFLFWERHKSEDFFPEKKMTVLLNMCMIKGVGKNLKASSKISFVLDKLNTI